MSAPNITWVFEATHDVTRCTRMESISAPVDADQDKLVAELSERGYYAIRLDHKEWGRWAWPGDYPIYYVCEDGGVLCSTCVNAEIEFTGAPDAEAMWKIVGSGINWEDAVMQCCHCGQHVESAYGEPDTDAQQELESREEQ